MRRFDHLNLGYISIGLSTHNLGAPIKNTANYLFGMEQSIEKLRREREKWTEKSENKKSKQMLASYDSWMGRLAFHLYGFGEQAGEWEDLKTKERALTLARRIFSEDEYRGIVQKRIDEEGRFRITKEDLE